MPLLPFPGVCPFVYNLKHWHIQFGDFGWSHLSAGTWWWRWCPGGKCCRGSTVGHQPAFEKGVLGCGVPFWSVSEGNGAAWLESSVSHSFDDYVALLIVFDLVRVGALDEEGSGLGDWEDCVVSSGPNEWFSNECGFLKWAVQLGCGVGLDYTVCTFSKGITGLATLHSWGMSMHLLNSSALTE